MTKKSHAQMDRAFKNDVACARQGGLEEAIGSLACAFNSAAQTGLVGEM